MKAKIVKLYIILCTFGRKTTNRVTVAQNIMAAEKKANCIFGKWDVVKIIGTMTAQVAATV